MKMNRLSLYNNALTGFYKDCSCPAHRSFNWGEERCPYLQLLHTFLFINKKLGYMLWTLI